MNGKIYVVTNIINNKMYVGQTWRDVKWYFECQLLNTKRPDRPKLCNAINKYGKDRFRVKVIDAAPTQLALDRLEIFYIKKFDSIKNGYNCCPGGQGGKGGPMPQETRDRISLAKKGVANMKLRLEFSDEEIQDILHKYGLGWSPTKISKLYSCSKTPIKRVLSEHNIKLRSDPNLFKPKITIEIANDIRDKYNQGQTQISISKLYGISNALVSKIVNNKVWEY